MNTHEPANLCWACRVLTVTVSLLLVMKANLRKTVFNLHLYAALGVGLFLLVASITGALLSFRIELDRAWNPHLLRVSAGAARLSVDQLVAAVRLAHPSGKIDYVEFNPAADAAVQVRFRDQDEVYLNPYTGEFLGSRNKDRTFFYSVEKIHRYLILGKPGQLVTGGATLAPLFMLGSGVYLWMPKSLKSVRSAFAFNRKLQGRAWKVNLHKGVGIYAAAVLSITAVTGAAEAISWAVATYVHPPATARLAARLLRSSGSAGSPGSVSLESEFQTACAYIPEFRVARFTFPETTDGPIQVELVAATAPHPNALSCVFLDGFTGEVLRFAPYEKESWANRLILWTLPLHLGQMGGMLGRLVTLAGTLCLPILVVSGFWLYYRRKLNPIKRAVPAASFAGEAAAVPAVRPRR